MNSKNKGGHKKLIKRITIVVVTVLVIVAAGASWIYIDSTRAINDYRDAIDKQYKEAVDDGTLTGEVKIRGVVLADVINPKYQKMKALAGEYSSLLKSLRNYTVTMRVHNKFVEQYNSGMRGTKILSGDILTSAQEYAGVVRERYPDETDRIAKLTALTQKITESTTFDEVSVEVNGILHDNDSWLNELRKSIDEKRESFQSKINNL